MQQDEVLLSVYAIKNSKGQYFRATGYRGSGCSWVDDLKKARIYGKIGPARSRVTYFTKHYPQLERPIIIELQVKTMVEIDESERVKKSIVNKQKRELINKKRMLQYNIDHKQKELKRLQEEINMAENLLQE